MRIRASGMGSNRDQCLWAGAGVGACGDGSEDGDGDGDQDVEAHGVDDTSRGGEVYNRGDGQRTPTRSAGDIRSLEQSACTSLCPGSAVCGFAIAWSGACDANADQLGLGRRVRCVPETGKFEIPFQNVTRQTAGRGHSHMLRESRKWLLARAGGSRGGSLERAGMIQDAMSTRARPLRGMSDSQVSLCGGPPRRTQPGTRNQVDCSAAIGNVAVTFKCRASHE
ncbi:hypothetical protein FB451DRAFT_1187435 [Mycena latifolia]|nr:hypothetical protein FB451DRAFT_1187435 [Mycena latifolia]